MRFSFKKLAAGLLAATCLVGPGISNVPAAIPPKSEATPTTLVIPPRVSSLYNNAAQICGPITGGAANPVIEKRIQDFNQVISKSQTGRDLLQAAATYDSQPAWICFKQVEGLHAVYYINRGVLTVALNKTTDEIVADAAHELRHLFQEKAGIHNIEPKDNNDRIHLEYAGEADAEATTSLMMWELKEAGHPGPWNAHNNPRNYGPRSICYAHISTSFKNAIEGGKTVSEASRITFRAWYRDRDLLSYYKDTALAGISAAKSPESTLHMHQRVQQTSSCHNPEPERTTRGYELPSPYISEKISGVTGRLPAYDINYIQQGGGLLPILMAP